MLFLCRLESTLEPDVSRSTYKDAAMDHTEYADAILKLVCLKTVDENACGKYAWRPL